MTDSALERLIALTCEEVMPKPLYIPYDGMHLTDPTYKGDDRFKPGCGLDLLPVCGTLHMHLDGSAEPLDRETYDLFVEFLQWRYDHWTVTKWNFHGYEMAVMNLILATLLDCERGKEHQPWDEIRVKP